MKTLALNILDLVQNSIRAGADDISITIHENAGSDLYRIQISDNGSGMPEEILNNVTDPFFTTRTKRRMGLGIPLMKHHAELTGGDLKISSSKGRGTEVESTFSFSHPDRQPLGDIPGVLKILIAANPGIEFIYRHVTGNGDFSLSTRELKEYLETDDLRSNDLLTDISGLVTENLTRIKASGLV